MRLIVVTLAFAMIFSQRFACAQSLTIINTSQHDVVIGIYEPTENGIRERLVSIKSLTETRKVPLTLAPNECFAIAYKATVENGEVKRSSPVAIYGMTKLDERSVRKNDPAKDEFVLQYRGSSPHPELDPLRTNLYTARGNGDEIKKEVTHAFGDKIVKIDYEESNASSRTKP